MVFYVNWDRRHLPQREFKKIKELTLNQGQPLVNANFNHKTLNEFELERDEIEEEKDVIDNNTNLQIEENIKILQLMKIKRKSEKTLNERILAQ